MSDVLVDLKVESSPMSAWTSAFTSERVEVVQDVVHLIVEAKTLTSRDVISVHLGHDVRVEVKIRNIFFSDRTPHFVTRPPTHSSLLSTTTVEPKRREFSYKVEVSVDIVVDGRFDIR